VVRSFRDLEVWQLGMNLAEAVYRCTADLPKNETFGLSAQMRRAAVSVPSNIAEGQARSSSKEFLQFISISLGSLAELETQLEIARRLGHETQVAEEQIELLGKKLHCLQAALRSRITSHQARVTSH
jgi:four helix bundle protein